MEHALPPQPDDPAPLHPTPHRLAVYGTLAPGRPNNSQLDGLPGRWIDGWVRGVLYEEGWGAAYGYPAIVLDDDGPQVAVQVFESIDLVAHWQRLDEFEGPAYRRVEVHVTTDEGQLPAWIYVLAKH